MDSEALPLDKDQLYRLRHPDRVRDSYRRHWELHRDEINWRRREKRRLFREAVKKSILSSDDA